MKYSNALAIALLSHLLFLNLFFHQLKPKNSNEELPDYTTRREVECIRSNLQLVYTKKKRGFVYEKKYKEDTVKYAAQCGNTAATR